MDLSNFQLVETMNDMEMLRSLSNNDQQYSQKQSNSTNNYDQFQQDINLLFQSNTPTTSSPHVNSFLSYHHAPKHHLANHSSPHYRITPQQISDCYEQEDMLTPLISPAMTPSFSYQLQQQPQQQQQQQNNKSVNFGNDLDFSPLSSPAMHPQSDGSQQQKPRFMSANQIREQYEQLEQAKLLITQKLSELQKSQQQQQQRSQQYEVSLISSDTSSQKDNIKNDAHQNGHVSTHTSQDTLRMEPATPASLMKISNRTPKADSPLPPTSLPPFNSEPIVAATTHPTTPSIAPRKQRASIKKEKPAGRKKQRRESTDPKAIASPRALKPLLISPTLRPGTNALPTMLSLGGSQVASVEDAERILATRSNYQNLMEGKGAALGIAFNSQIKSGLEVRRTAHKAAEQKRRDSLKEWFDRLRCEVEEGYVKRQKSLMSQVIQAQELEVKHHANEGEKSTEDDEGSPGSQSEATTMKPLSKVLLLQYAYEYITSLKKTLSEKDATIERLIAGEKLEDKDKQGVDEMQVDSPTGKST
ncbi:hypothetical protein G6F70_001096 [Rhizopus microsporus]|uniref:BHLH domain-containing protein n=2 Tax=Rhizopus TaxID=4842 RepID=A0A367K7V4_RHIAZ|nr:hypothetical protein G6F71_001073 [Rhizopus microsporus]RCH98294.1 hypothetical protein CU097_007807 [Rhizopus azygosporus]KAG1203720.1 hypothetical protein G6F70_001096 [Rhizopus microsporus]KAG1216385.1 hypothetical protein G6F69_000147 [Rhizopus microsporus]KAG1237675.1 hypothetical protein G6F67_000993 [Rhizopus microsporus]